MLPGALELSAHLPVTSGDQGLKQRPGSPVLVDTHVRPPGSRPKAGPWDAPSRLSSSHGQCQARLGSSRGVGPQGQAPS